MMADPTLNAQTPSQPSALSPVINKPNYFQGVGALPQLTTGMTFSELGNTGLRAFAGYVREEFLPQLQARQAQTVYREMADNSPVIGGILYAINATMRKVEWRVVPADDTPAAQEMAEFVESLQNDMSHTWEDSISEGLSMVQFGFAPQEIIYKRRLGRKPGMDPQRPGERLPSSQFDDGRIGWRSLPIRGQDTIIKWFFDQNGGTRGLTQQPWVGPLVDVPIEKLLLFRPSQHKGNPEGRPLPLDTPVRTPSGWTTMGAIKVGDRVYDEQGQPRSVTGKSEIFTDRPVYEIEFSTGSRIRADACHIWRVSDDNDRTHGRTRDMTTQQLADQLDRAAAGGKPGVAFGPSQERFARRKARSISCGVAPVLEAEDVALPLDPYILGYWLGNGITGKAAFSVSKTDRFSIGEQFEAAGFTLNYDGNTTVSVSNGLLLGLRAAGVLTNKHVPQRYLLASPDQRLALLQGLMDADGHAPGVDAKDKASTFANTNMGLIASVEELVRSLGSQPRVRLLESAGSLGGVVNGHQIVARLDSYEVRYLLDKPVHRLPRKLHAQAMVRTNRSAGHFIRSIQRVDNADTVCIEVDSPSHLFLAGEGMVPTHNSVLRNAYRSYFMVKRIEEQEAILYERMNGIPVIRVPSQLMEMAKSGDADAVAAMNLFKSIAVNLRIDEQMGLVLPSDMQEGANGPSAFPAYSLELVAPGGNGGRASVTGDQTIVRHQNNMFMSVLADFISLGHGPTGTQALATSKTGMFFQSIEGYLNGMASVYNRHGLKRVWELNALDPDLMPELQPDLAQDVDLDILGNYVNRLATSGMALFPNPDLEGALMDAAGLPDIDDPGAAGALGGDPSDGDGGPVPIAGPMAALHIAENAPPPPVEPGSPKDKFAKMIRASLAKRMVRKAGPRLPIRR